MHAHLTEETSLKEIFQMQLYKLSSFERFTQWAMTIQVYCVELHNFICPSSFKFSQVIAWFFRVLQKLLCQTAGTYWSVYLLRYLNPIRSADMLSVHCWRFLWWEGVDFLGWGQSRNRFSLRGRGSYRGIIFLNGITFKLKFIPSTHSLIVFDRFGFWEGFLII
jgi:hypothetical protein